MAKTYEEIQKETQERIDKAINRKETRQSKTEISIGFRWAVNVAVAFLPEHLKGTKKGFNQITKWLEKFQDLDRNYMIENMIFEPIEQIKLKAVDFAIAKENAPESEAIQSKAEDLAGQEPTKTEEEINEMTTTIPIIDINKNE